MPETATDTASDPDVVDKEPVTAPETPPQEEEDEDLGEAGKAALHKEREARRKATAAQRAAEAAAAEAKKQLDALAAKVREFEDRDKTESQKQAEALEELRKALADKESELESARLASMKAEVAAAKGVPSSSLVGSTKEELEASADELIAWRDANTKIVRKPPTTSPGLKSGAHAPGDHSSDKKQRAAQALRDLQRGA